MVLDNIADMYNTLYAKPKGIEKTIYFLYIIKRRFIN